MKLRTSTPSFCAFNSFDPAFSPATTNAVFLETEPEILPPIERQAVSAMTRGTGIAPVKTAVPRSGRSILGAISRVFGVTPLPRISSTALRLCSFAKKLVIASDMRGPIPSISTKALELAVRTLLNDPKCSASALATVTPTSGIPSATRNRLRSGERFESMALTSASADVWPKPSNSTSCEGVRSNSSPSWLTSP